MRRIIKPATMMIAAFGLLVALLLSGCGVASINNRGRDSSQTSQPAQPSQELQTPQQSQEMQTQQPSHTEEQMKAFEQSESTLIVLPEFPIPTASGTDVEENDRAVIDFSNTQHGYIMAKYTEASDETIKLLITGPDEVRYQYRLQPENDFEAFPLTAGDGLYEVGVFKRVEGTRFSQVLSTTIEVSLVDEFAPFLRSNQFVNFNRDSDAVRKAAELTAGVQEFMEKVAAIYHFVITNIDYDIELAETVEVGYVPDIDMVLARGKGICFDYASLMTAMLRSQGIPTKLVIGYTGEVRHAWISVYSKESGWLDNVIFFDGHEWWLVDPTFAASGSAQAVAQFIGDGTNYVATHAH